MSDDARLTAPNELFAFAHRTKASSYFDVASLALLVSRSDLTVLQLKTHPVLLVGGGLLGHIEHGGEVELTPLLNVQRPYPRILTQIEYIWPARWSPAKVLYLFSRYLVFFDIPFAVHYHTVLGLEPKVWLYDCITRRRGKPFMISTDMPGYVSRRDDTPLATHLAWISMFGVFLSGIEFGPSPLPTVLGCVILPPKKRIYSTLLAGAHIKPSTRLAIVLMMFIIGLLKYRHLRNSPLITIFYRDGFFYFAVLTAFSIANMIVDIIGPIAARISISHGYASSTPLCQRVIHSILSCRMVLHMKKYAAVGEEFTAWTAGQSDYPFQPMQFARNTKVHAKAGSGTARESSAWERGDPRVNTSIRTDDIELALAGSRRQGADSGEVVHFHRSS
ncbi:hypothetical protein NMY22_g2365 [Coprinellus aureogranulatus]|nr:hypothetical protein NMY22_g2365 [Coprinellus aureogranulatus]